MALKKSANLVKNKCIHNCCESFSLRGVYRPAPRSVTTGGLKKSGGLNKSGCLKGLSIRRHSDVHH